MRWLFACVCCLSLCTPAFAQETVNSASVSGRVVDPQGAVVPGALVVALQTETTSSRKRSPTAKAASVFRT